MHVVIGLAGLIAVLVYTVKSGHTGGFTGFVHPPAIVLLCLAPVFIAICSYRFEDLRSCLSTLLRALRFSTVRSRRVLYEELARFASDVRQHRPAQALAVAESASHELVRQLAPLVVKQYTAAALESTASTAAHCQASALKRSEDVLLTLARMAPATGLVGTVLGLVSLLKELSRFEKLGPSMALALLCTLYGLVLANGVYQPMARLIRSYAVATLEESKLLTRALVLIGEGKPMADVRALFEGTARTPVPAGERPANPERLVHE